MAVTMTATVDGAASKAVEAALTNFKSSCAEIAANAPRMIALRVCDSLRKETRKARPKKKSSDWGAEPIHHSTMTEWNINGRKYLIPTPSPYITNPRNGRHGVSNGLMLHRYMFTTRKGTPAAQTFPVAAYSRLKHTKRGRIVTDTASEKSELREVHALNMQSGLAANSWLWVKRGIASTGADPVYRKRKNDRRDPKRAVRGTSWKDSSVSMTAGYAEIHNHIDYIQQALKPGAVDRAIQNAAIKQVYMQTLNDMRKIGMSAEEAAAKARQTASAFKHDVLGL